MKNNFSRILGEQLGNVSEVSRMTGISRWILSGIYYQRAKDTKLSTLVRICDYLQVPLSELVEYVPKKEG